MNKKLTSAVLSTILILMTTSGAVADFAQSQEIVESIIAESKSVGEGWAGFADISFIANAISMLLLAAALAALMGTHPKHGKTVDTIEELETLQIYTIYAVVGALVGIMVVKYGLIVGFVLFGIGGLIRFRTVLKSPTWTGRLIFVALIGLSCGLNLPHVAVIASLFGWMLIFLVDSRVTYRLQIKGIEFGRFDETTEAYRAVLGDLDCRVLREKKCPRRKRLTYLFRCKNSVSLERLEKLFETRIAPELQATADWEVD